MTIEQSVLSQESYLVPGVVQFVPTVERILYGAGIMRTHLAAEVDRLEGKRVLLVIPRSLVDSSIVAHATAALGDRLVETFSDRLEHVPLEGVVAAADTARQSKSDCVVCLGGGSVIDTGKGLRACLAAGLTSPDALGKLMEAPTAISNSWLPQISIPTTLSGSEYTRSFSTMNTTQQVKRSYTHSACASKTILYDPNITVSTPPSLWFASGIMAIDHAVEVFCASPSHVVGDSLKLAALQTLLGNLPATHTGTGTREARLRCQVAAWQADHSPLRTQPLQPQPTALHSHALAYELSSLCNLSYSITACVTLPACLRWDAAHRPQATTRQAQLARALGFSSADKSDEESAPILADQIEEFIQQFDLPTKLHEVSVSKQDLQHIAQQFTARNAVPPGAGASTEAEVMGLLESAW